MKKCFTVTYIGPPKWGFIDYLRQILLPYVGKGLFRSLTYTIPVIDRK